MGDTWGAVNWWAEQALPAIHSALRAVLPFEWARYSFILNALIMSFLLAPLCAAMGVQIVNFRLAFFSDAISHSAFTGVAIGFLLNEFLSRWGGSFDPQIAIVLFGLLVALGIAVVRRRTELSNDVVVGVFFSLVIALGLAIITARGARTTNFQHYLYGDILTLGPLEIAVTALLTIVVVIAVGFAFTPLTLIGLNAELAHSQGVAVRRFDYLFSLLLALVVSVTIRMAGILLVTGMLLLPAATARNLARSAGGMFLWTLAVAWVGGVGGTILSFSPWLEDVSTGSVIVLTTGLLFGLSVLTRRRGG
jgi:zinc transport system permease protein